MFKFISGMVAGSIATIFTLALVSINDRTTNYKVREVTVCENEIAE